MLVKILGYHILKVEIDNLYILYIFIVCISPFLFFVMVLLLIRS